MRKLLGSIIIMLILAQPVQSEASCNIETFSIHIFQESRDFEILDTVEKNNNEEDFTTIEDLSDTMDFITNLLKVKNETVSDIQNLMNSKVKNKEIMTQEQITKFQEFSNYTKEKNNELQLSLNDIASKKNLTKAQEAILQNDIDYNKLQEEITSVKNSQDIAISCLTGIINLGNNVLKSL